MDYHPPLAFCFPLSRFQYVVLGSLLSVCNATVFVRLIHTISGLSVLLVWDKMFLLQFTYSACICSPYKSGKTLLLHSQDGSRYPKLVDCHRQCTAKELAPRPSPDTMHQTHMFLQFPIPVQLVCLDQRGILCQRSTQNGCFQIGYYENNHHQLPVGKREEMFCLQI